MATTSTTAPAGKRNSSNEKKSESSNTSSKVMPEHPTKYEYICSTDNLKFQIKFTKSGLKT